MASHSGSESSWAEAEPPPAKREQLDLVGGGRPRAIRACCTSRLATTSVEPLLKGLQRDVLRVVRDAGPDGYTCDEVEQALGRTHQTVSARVHELFRMGAIVDTGRRRPTRSQRLATVWCVAEHATGGAAK